MSGRVFCILWAVSVFLCLISGASSAETIYVDANASGDASGSDWSNGCTTITAGLALAATGDQVWVKSATYPEAISLKGGVGLYGGFPSDGSPAFEERDWRVHETIIDAAGLNSSVVSAVSVVDTAIDGITITGGYAERGAGINIEGSAVIVRHCTIRGNFAAAGSERSTDKGGGGIACSPEFYSRVRIYQSIIEDNISTGRGGGIFCSSEVTVGGCVIARNRAGWGGGAIDANTLHMKRCTVVDNRSGAGIGGVAVEEFDLLFSILWNDGCERGEYYWGTGSRVVLIPWPPSVPYWIQFCCVQGGTIYEDNTDADPLFVDRENGDYRLLPTSPCIDFRAMSAWPCTELYYDLCNPDDFWFGCDIFAYDLCDWEGVDLDGHARPGGDGYVDIGAYETPDGYFPGNRNHVPRVLYVDAEAAEGGDGSSWNSAFRTMTAAMRVASTSDEIRVAAGRYPESVQVERTTGLYGGLWGDEATRDPRNPTAHPAIIDATGLGTPGAIMDAWSTLDGFHVTRGEGVGVGSSGDSTTISRCFIEGNQGAGVGLGKGGKVVNCVIAGNVAEYYGGGIAGVDGTVVNCTIVGNSAGIEGGGLYFIYPENTWVTNCILWNRGKEFAGYGSFEGTVTYSCVRGGWPGEGNITGDPLFVDLENGDYHLQRGSACIDRASDSASPGLDLEGSPRPGKDHRVDMGAFESDDKLKPGPLEHVPGVLYVRSDADPGGDGSTWQRAFPRINAALEMAGSSDEIWVAGGTYRESVLLERGVSVYGGFSGAETDRAQRDWVANETVIDASGLESSAVIGADFARLDGVTVTGGSGLRQRAPYGSEWGYGGGIYCYETSPTVENCRIIGNNVDARGGGSYCWDSSPEFINCLIFDNMAPTGAAAYVNSGSPGFLNCTIAGNVASARAAVYGYDSLPAFTNCILRNPGEELVMIGDSTAEVSYTCIQGDWPGEGNIDDVPGFADPANGDYHLLNGSPCVDRGLLSAAPAGDLEMNPRPGGDGLVDLGAYESPDGYVPAATSEVPMVIHVREGAPEGGDGVSWSTAFPSVTEALEIAGSSDELWVAAGTYREALQLERGVEIYGGFAGWETSREERDWFNHRTVIDATGLGTRTVTGANMSRLDGVTITGGQADDGGGVRCAEGHSVIANCTITGNSASGEGGGVCLPDEAGITMMNCIVSDNGAGSGGGLFGGEVTPGVIQGSTFEENAAESSGGGIAFYGGYTHRSGALDIVDCVLSGNFALRGGGLAGFSGGLDFSLRRCRISGNTAVERGGGLYVTSPVDLHECVLNENRTTGDGGLGGGLCTATSSWVRLFACTISGNSAWTGGGLYGSSSNLRLANCLVSGNSADPDRDGRGGGLWRKGYKNSLLVNCTVTGNEAADGGGLWCDDSEVSPITNTILWGNTPGEVTVLGATPDVSFSDIEEDFPGEGNINVAPAFVYPWNGSLGDVHLLPGSPCIDSGSNEAAAGILTDLDGTYRVLDGDDIPGALVDMGVFEFDPAFPRPTMTPTVTPTPTITPSPTITPTKTPTPVPGDTTGDGLVDAHDLFQFARWWQCPENGENKACDRVDDGKIDEYDLERLMMDWK